MAIDIASEVTGAFPMTEAALLADDTITYAEEKVRAIARAKRALYGKRTIPDAADIPDEAAYWIADKAVMLLIPVATDFYMVMQRLSDSKEGTNFTYYNKVTRLERLRTELEASSVAGKSTAIESIDASNDADDVPAVSHRGMVIDPMVRAFSRGPLF